MKLAVGFRFAAWYSKDEESSMDSVYNIYYEVNDYDKVQSLRKYVEHT